MEFQTAVDLLFILICTSLLALVILGIALFYLGLIQRRLSFTMLAGSIVISVLVLVDWFIWGYSLCYASSNNHFIGSLKFVVLTQLRHDENLIYLTPRGDILSIVHFLFNGLMKMICVSLTFPGCAAERGRLKPMLVFVFLWSAIVYNPVTYWFWNRNGWLLTQQSIVPVLDFAGGNCIHIVSGFTALAYLYYLGPRNPKILHEYRSSSSAFVVLGLCLLSFGWLGFIAGCDYKFSATSIFIMVNSLLCASCAGIVWATMDFYYLAVPLEGQPVDDLDVLVTVTPTHRTFSMVSFSSGMITGLVVYTPAGGYFSTPGGFWKAVVCGVIGGVVGNLATRLKYFLNIDDALDIFAVHGVAGVTGSLLVGIFAENSYDSKGGWIVGHWVQLGYQVCGLVVTAVYVFVASLFLLYLVDLVPGLHLRIDINFNGRMRQEKLGIIDHEDLGTLYDALEHAEIMGSDWYEFDGEFLSDYMEFVKVASPDEFVEYEKPVEARVDQTVRRRAGTEN